MKLSFLMEYAEQFYPNIGPMRTFDYVYKVLFPVVCNCLKHL